MPVVDEANQSLFVDDHLRGNPSEFEEVDFLTIHFQHCIFWVGQADERKVMFLPVCGKGQCIFGANYHDFDILFQKFVVLTAQLRHVPLAVGSKKAAVKNQEYVLFLFKIGKAEFFSVEICQCEVWSGDVKFDMVVHVR